MNISNNISSIQAHQTMLNTGAHNIANVNTDNFRPNDTSITENGNSVAATNRQTSDSGSPRSQTNVAKELTDQIVATDATSVNVSAIKAQDEMFGTLLDIKV